MKRITFSKQSWHYRMLIWWDIPEYKVKADFCAYFWQVFFTGMKIAGETAFLVLILVLLSGGAIGGAIINIYLLMYLLASFVTGVWTNPEALAGARIVLYFLSIIGLVFWELLEREGRDIVRFLNSIAGTIEDRTHIVEKVTHSSFLNTAYESFKNKVCFYIDFKD